MKKIIFFMFMALLIFNSYQYYASTSENRVDETNSSYQKITDN